MRRWDIRDNSEWLVIAQPAQLICGDNWWHFVGTGETTLCVAGPTLRSERLVARCFVRWEERRGQVEMAQQQAPPAALAPIAVVVDEVQINSDAMLVLAPGAQHVRDHTRVRE